MAEIDIETPADAGAVPSIVMSPPDGSASADPSAKCSRPFPLRMSPAEARFLEDLLASAKVYLEWGAGGSTLAAVRSNVQIIVSVETDKTWIDRLRQNDEIAAAAAAQRLLFRHIDVGPVARWGVPLGQGNIRNWPRYAVEPFVATDFDFDLILVDGRFRIHCLLAAANCASDGALVFLHDYAFRHSYTMADKYFDTIKRIDSGVLLKRRADINRRALYIDVISSIF